MTLVSIPVLGRDLVSFDRSFLDQQLLEIVNWHQFEVW